MQSYAHVCSLKSGLLLIIMDESSGLFFSGSGFSKEETILTSDPCLKALPNYFVYLSVGFKFIAALITFLLAGWVFATIKKTRNLHKPHNIFVANLMITDIIMVLLIASLQCAIMLEYVIGLDFISCNVLAFLLFPSLEAYFTFLMISGDKMITIVFPFKHRKIMTKCVITGVIILSWMLSVAFFFPRLNSTDIYTKSQKYGNCRSTNSGFLLNLFTQIIPTMVSSMLTLGIDIYLSVKGCQVNKQIQREARLSGATSQLQGLKKKQAAIKKNLKPMMTLLVVALGGTVIGLLYPLLSVAAKLLEPSAFNQCVISEIINPNIFYIIILLHPCAYGLYFKQIRDPMMKLMKSIVKLN